VWNQLRRDTLLRVAAGSLLVLPLLWALPALTADAAWIEDILVPPLLHALVLAALLSRRGRALQPDERTFWNLLAAGYAFWLIVSLFYLLLPGVQEDVWAWLASDLAYLLFYLFLALATEVEPQLATASSLRRRFRSIGTFLFLFGLLTYFVLIPSHLDREAYGTWVPSMLLFVVLDLYLLARWAAATRAATSAHWRRVFGLLATVAVIWTASDALEALSLAGVVGTHAGDPLWLVWYAPFYGMIVAGRMQGLGATRQQAPRRHVHARTSDTPLLVFALILPALHYLLYGLGWLEETSRGARELFVFGGIVVLGGLALTYQVLLERRNRALSHELMQVNSELQRANRLESIGRLAGGVAHDFNNLLTVIRGCAEVLMLGDGVQPGATKHLRTIVDATSQGSTLTRQLLALGSKQLLQPAKVDLNQVVFDAERLLRSVFGERVRYRTRIAPDAGPVFVDPTQIGQVLLNLAVNARDAMPHGGTFTVTTHNERVGAEQTAERPQLREGSYVVLSVEDTGEGMDEATLERIFDPFFSTKPGGHGSGLGLATVYGIVRQSGGDAQVDSAPGRGTRFRIFLPRADAAVAKPLPRAKPAAGSDGATVLLVDDETGIRDLLQDLLRDEGYDVITAPNGRAALDLAAVHDGSIDLLLTDVVMPVMDGAELAERLARVRPQTPVLFMSGYVESPDPRLEEAHAAGALIHKPFSTSFILERVRAVLEGPERA